MKEKYLVFMLCSLFNSLLFSQVEPLEIIIHTDNKPEEISWSLLDMNGNLLLADNGILIDSNTTYTQELAVEIGDCFQFVIKDSGGDGIQSPGYYRLKRGDNIIVDNFNFTLASQHHYTGKCGFGESCDKAEPILYNRMLGQPYENYWYTFTPSEDGIYYISTCNSEELDTKMWIYDNCPNIISDGPEGAISYSDDFNGCPPGSGFNQIPLLGNTTYYIRVGLIDTTWTDLVELTFISLPEVLGCIDPASCNYNPFANKEDGSCEYTSDCAPDLVINQQSFSQSLFLDTMVVEDNCLLDEACVSGLGVRQIIRFTTSVSNDGNVDYIIGYPEDNPDGFSIDNCHEHWHQLGYAEYLLFGGQGEQKPVGFKNGFCVADIDCDDPSIFPKYNCNYMGISAGCTDVYDYTIPCQWIDVTDIPDGDYTMIARINWAKLPDLRGMEESNYENNWTQVCINLDRTSGQLLLDILEDCPPYVDCFGNINGSVVLDCEGQCNGLAEYGDANNNGEANKEDIHFYMDGIADTELTPTSCNDLNADGQISVYDAALIQQCLQSGIVNGEPHFHCRFPGGIDNQQEKSVIGITAVNHTENYIDVAYQSQSKLIAFQFSLTGIDRIIRIENKNPINFSPQFSRDNQVFGLLADTTFSETDELTPLIRIYFNKVNTDKISISNIKDVINGDYHKIVSEIIDLGIITPNDTLKDCQKLRIDTANRAIIISNIAKPSTKIEYLGPATGWETTLLCNSCDSRQTIENLTSGSYLLKVQTFNPYCYAEYQVEVNNDSKGTCYEVIVEGGKDEIQITNIATNSKIEVAGQSTDWIDQLICNGNCSSSEVITDLEEGAYTIKIQTYNPYCFALFEVYVTADTPSDCHSVEVNVADRQLTISNISQNTKIEVSGYGKAWNNLLICDGDCKETEAVQNLVDGTYQVKIQTYNPYCFVQKNIVISRLVTFPSPTYQDLWVDMTPYGGQTGSLILQNQFGKIINQIDLSTIPKGMLKLNTNNYGSGIYFISVQTDKRRTITKKIVIAKF